MKKFKQFLEEKIILSAVMCVLLAVVLVTATYGWYALSNTDRAYGLRLKTGGEGGFIVAIEPNGPDIMSGEYYKKYYNRFGGTPQFNDEDGKLIAKIPINLGEFENIESEKIAPGAYGPLPFYITSLSESIKSYTIKVQFEYKPDRDENAGELTEEEKKKAEYVESMIMDHFTIYQKKYTDKEGIVRFSDPLTFYLKETDQDVIAARGALQMGVEVPVEIYWVWNYELTDIPDYEKLERFKNYDLSRDENGNAINVSDTRRAVRKYDEEDTELGNYLDHIWFNVYIEGGMDAYHAVEPIMQSDEAEPVAQPGVDNPITQPAAAQPAAQPDAVETETQSGEDNPETQAGEDDSETQADEGSPGTQTGGDDSDLDNEGSLEGVRD